MKKTVIIITVFIFSFLNAFTQISWNMGMNIASSSYGNQHPRIVTDAAGNPMVVWNHSMKVMFSKWNGTSFTMPVQLNPASMNVAGATWMGPDIASRGDTVYIVFKLMPEGDTASHVYIIRSFDGGASFSLPFQVDQIADSISRFPTVAVDDSGNPVVAFMKFDASFMDARWVVARSADFGTTFSTDVKASGWGGSGAVCDCCPGALANSGSSMFMVYRDNNGNLRDIWAGISTDNGSSYTSGMNVDQNNWQLFSCPGSGPDGVIAGDSLYTVYMSGASGSSRVYFSAASASAMTGAMGNEITGPFAGLGVQNYPRIATDGTALGIAWKQSVSGTDQAALLFTNNVTLGFPSAYDTVDLGHVTNVDLAISNGTLYYVWEDDNSGTIKFRSGTFNATTGLPEKSLTSVLVYPSSCEDIVNIYAPVPNAKVNIMDIVGRIQMQAVLSGKTSQLSIGHLAKGTYLVQVITESFETLTTKIIKQ